MIDLLQSAMTIMHGGPASRLSALRVLDRLRNGPYGSDVVEMLGIYNLPGV